jgi:mRNA interferase RelE/StbE
VISISIDWERKAVKELAAVPKKEQRRIVDAVALLRRDPLRGKPLSAEWKGLRRLRVGDYRVIYAFDGKKLRVCIVRVGHRRGVYDAG